MRSRRGWKYLVSVVGVVAVVAVLWPVVVGPAGVATAQSCGACGTGGQLQRIESIVSGRGRTTLCQISKISPSNNGGTSNIEIFTFSKTNSCDNRSTAHQGALYLVQSETAADAKYLLALASITPSFLAGWQTGKVAILLGTGTTPLHGIETALALRHHARFSFTHA